MIASPIYYSELTGPLLGVLSRLQPGYFTEEILDYYLEEAGRRKVPEAVSLLMEYRRRHFKVQRKRYTF